MENQQTVLTFLDGYCERAGDPGLWGEPLNAVTNLLFMLAAIAAYMAARHLPNRRFNAIGDIYALIAALAGIAIGSGLWHMIPTKHTVLMDVLPITLFINIYLIAALRRFFNLPWKKVAALWALYFTFGLGAQAYIPPETLNGTIMYVPTWMTLLVLTMALTHKDRAIGKTFTIILTVWSASLLFRTVDLEICEQFPMGTHFLWHALNAWVLYRLLKALIQAVK